MEWVKKSLWGTLSLITVLLLLLAGCGGSPKKPPAISQLTRIEVTVDDIPVTDLVVRTNSEIQFEAKGYDQNNNPMEGLDFQWAIEPETVGIINKQTGWFQAGSEEGEGEIVCKAKGVTKKVSVQVSDEEPILKEIIIKLEVATVRPGDSREFQAIAIDQYGEPMSGIDFTWSVEPVELGRFESVSEDADIVKFIAGTEAGEGTIICQADEFEKRDQAKVKVAEEESRLSSIQITPTEVVVAPEAETEPFEVIAFDQFGKEMDGIAFTWSVEPAWLGKIEVKDNEVTFVAGEREGKGEIICQAHGVMQKVTVSVFHGRLYLQSAAEQLVSDTQTAWTSFTTAPRLVKIMDEQLVPGAMLVISAIKFGSIVPDCGDALYYCDPTPGSEYYDLEKIYEGYDYESPPKTGTWRYIEKIFGEDEAGEEYVFGYLKAIITRKIVNNGDQDEDQILFNLRLEYLNGEWIGTYSGELRYPTTNWDMWEYDEIDEFPHVINFDDSIKLSIRYEDSYNTKVDIKLDGYSSETTYVYLIYDEEWGFSYYQEENVNHAFGGALDGKLTFNGGNYSVNGELNLDFTNYKTDYFTGTINLPDAVITGDMEIYYTSNPNQKQPLLEGAVADLIPQKIELDGSFKDKKSALALTGDLTLEFERAESFVYYEPYSPTNWPGLKVDFNGKLFNENNEPLIGTLAFEEAAYKRFMIDIGYDLMTDGVLRTIGLNAWTVSDDEVALKIASDWGPAEINMRLNFTPSFIDIIDNEFVVGKLNGLTGKVLVQDVEVGDIGLTDVGVKVEYKDGSYEMF